MKTRPATKVHYDSGPNMTPLVDVVMVILIFLMLAGTFGGAAQFLVSKQGLHSIGGHAIPNPNTPIDTPIEIHVDNNPDPSSIDGGGFRAQGAGIKPTNSGEVLRQELATKLEQFKAAGTSADQLQIVLYPGRNVKYRSLIEVYQAALQANYTKIAFATSR